MLIQNHLALNQCETGDFVGREREAISDKEFEKNMAYLIYFRLIAAMFTKNFVRCFLPLN